MGKPQIRSSQVLMGYGPGAMVDLPDDSVIIAGLDTWRYNNGDPPAGMISARNPGRFKR